MEGMEHGECATRMNRETGDLAEWNGEDVEAGEEAGALQGQRGTLQRRRAVDDQRPQSKTTPAENNCKRSGQAGRRA